MLLKESSVLQLQYPLSLLYLTMKNKTEIFKVDYFLAMRGLVFFNLRALDCLSQPVCLRQSYS